MTYDPTHDPSLTAYALGELEGVEAHDVEKLIAEEPAAAAYVEEVRKTAAVLAGSFAAEASAAPTLSDDHRDAIEKAIADPAAAHPGDNGSAVASGLDESDEPYKFPVPFWMMKVAAIIAIAAFGTMLFLPNLQRAREQASPDVAMSNAAETATEADSPSATRANSASAQPTADEAYDFQATPRVDRSGVAYKEAATDPAKASRDKSIVLESAEKKPVDLYALSDGAKSGAPSPKLTSTRNAPSTATPPSAPTSPPAPMAPASRPTQSPVVVAAGKTVGGREVALAESEQLRRSRGQAAPEYRKLDAGQLGGAAPADAKAKYEGQLALANSVERKNEEVAKQQMRQLKAVDELQKDVDAEVDNRGGFNREGFDAITDNPFKLVADAHFSTFSIDVDTASYANVRRMVMGENRLPPAGAVRIEEMINYFPYYYDEPQGDDPFSANVEVAAAPWNTSHRLVRIGLHGKNVMKERPEANLVFLVDVSGSMNQPNKIGYVRQSLELLTKELDADDRIAIVVYAGAAGLVLDSTPVGEKEKILTALDRLRAGGSTNGGAGIQLAYKIATDHFVKGGINRVILCSDGDFNVGISDRASLIKLIEEKRESGVFLTTLGFGNGNLRDSQMEQLADKGNGAYNYIDSMREAKKVLCDELGGTLVTIAKDVKIQIDFNPAKVQAYRLIGYENRVLADEDFNDDRKDAGEIGSGHTVTALYEIVPVGVELAGVEKPGKVDDSVFQPKPVAPAANVPAELSDKLMLLKLRFKQPDGDTSVLRTFPVVDSGKKYDQATQDYKFAAAVAQFGMLLRNSPYKGSSNYDAVLELAGESIGKDKGGYRAEFVQIVEKAKALSTR